MKRVLVPVWVAFLTLGSPAFPGDNPEPAPSTRATSGPVPDQLILEGEALGERVPPEAGDICLICDQPIDEGDAVYLVQGQRVALHREEQARTTPGQLRALISRLKSHGAFLGSVEQRLPLSGAWFFLGLYVLFGLFFSALSAHRALHRGYSPFAWFGIGLVFSVLGYLALITRPQRAVIAPAGIPPGLGKIPATYAPELCLGCGADNHPSATRCSDCGMPLTPKVDSEVSKAGLPAEREEG